jgi:DNA-directed RNA polymerase subunit RPC12/RpoP
LTERELRTKSNEYNAATAVTMGYQEIRNSGENWDTIQRLFKEGRAKDLNDEPKKLLQPVILTGSGPSLDNTITRLKDWKGGVICHYSQAPTLMYHGVEPDYIVALDCVCNWEGLSCVDWSKTKTKLVLHPGMWPSLVKNWPNEMLFYRQNLGKPDSFGVNEQKVMFSKQIGGLAEALVSKMAWEPLVKTELTMFACTPPAQLFVAQILQYGAVFLTGMDFAYHGNKERFTKWDMEDGEWKEHPAILPERPAENPYIITNSGHQSDPLHLYYLKNFVSACRLSMQRVFTTDKGALTQVPYIEMDKVIESQGRKLPEIAPEKRALNYERYLASINCFCIQFEQGNAFVEVQNPIPDITGFMMGKNRQYVCQQCGGAFTARDDNAHDGDICPTCNKPKLKRINNCDVRANLNRIQALIDYNKEMEIA